MIKLKCPVCQSRYDLDQAAHEELLGRMVALASRFGKHWDLVTEYVACFRTSQWAGVSLQKKVRILGDLVLLFEKCEFEYDGKRYRTDVRKIAASITQIVNLEKFGFQNHNYLKKILLQESERISAEGLTAKEESKREEQRRDHARKDVTGTAQEDKGLTYSEWKKESLLGKLAANVGKSL